MIRNNLLPNTKKLCNITLKNLLKNYLNFENKKLILIDLETLGFDPNFEYEQITEIAGWIVCGDTMNIEKKFNYKIDLHPSSKNLLNEPNSIERNAWEIRQRKRGKSGILNPNQILELTQYNELQIQTRSEKDALNEFNELVSQTNNSIMIAHNIGFDMKFIFKKCKRYEIDFPEIKVLDTLALSRFFLSPTILTLCEDEYALKLKNSLQKNHNSDVFLSSKLCDLANSMNINTDKLHTASGDVNMMYLVLKELIKFLEKHEETDISSAQKRVIFRKQNHKKQTTKNPL